MIGLLIYIPLSKHFHVFIAPVNVYLKSSRPKGELKKIENIEEAEHFGVSKVQQFTWKDILDGYACTECGRCTSACPANLTDKPLDPKKIIVDLRLATYAQAGLHMVARHETRTITAATPLIGGGLIKDESSGVARPAWPASRPARSRSSMCRRSSTCAATLVLEATASRAN